MDRVGSVRVRGGAVPVPPCATQYHKWAPNTVDLHLALQSCIRARATTSACNVLVPPTCQHLPWNVSLARCPAPCRNAITNTSSPVLLPTQAQFTPTPPGQGEEGAGTAAGGA